MSSVQGYNDICNKCGHSSESYDYYYRTGEGWRYCAACGSYHSGLMRKTDSSYIQNNTICPLDGSYVIGIEDLFAGEMLWTHPITSEMDDDTLKRFLRMDECLYKQFNIPLSNKNYSSVFHYENGKYEQVLFVGDAIELEMVNGTTTNLILKQAVWDVTHEGGYGVIHMVYMNTEKPTIVVNFDKGISEGEALNLWKAYETEPIDFNKSYLTVWDDNQNKLRFLKGTPDCITF